MSGKKRPTDATLREGFVEAGRSLVLDSDPEAIDGADVAAELGVDEDRFYRCFDSTGELLLEIYSREVESFTEQLRAELSEIGDDSEAIRLFFERYLAFFAENPYMDAARSIDDAFGLALETPERARAFERTLLEQQLPLIEQVQQHSDGPIAEMDPAIVFGFLRPLRSLHSDVQTSDRAYFEAVLDALVDVLVRGLTSNGPAEQVH